MNNRRTLFFVFLLLGCGLLDGCSEPRFRVRTPPGKQVDMFCQGPDPDPKEGEVFCQDVRPQVDVLWVVDNSKSMQSEQQALADNFSYFFEYLDSTRADFHIGVMSTDVYSPDHQGRLLGNTNIITRATPQTAEVFAYNINVGVEGKGDEQGLKAMVLGLTEPLISTDNAGFLRDNAYLFVIFVSDEDDRSFGEVEYFQRRSEQIKGIGNDGMVKVAAVVGDVPEVPADCEAVPGTRYAEVASMSGGLVLSICDTSFASNLDQLGFSAAGLRRHFSLSLLPYPESIQVWVKTTCSAGPIATGICGQAFDDCNGGSGDVFGHVCVLRQALPDGWAYEESSNSIRFFGEALPPFGSIVEVGYVPREESP